MIDRFKLHSLFIKVYKWIESLTHLNLMVRVRSGWAQLQQTQGQLQSRWIWPGHPRSPKTCLFCLSKVRPRKFSTKTRLTRHLAKIHYFYVKDIECKCPHSHCKEMLRHIYHFQMHAMQVHEIDFTKECGMAFQQPMDCICDELPVNWTKLGTPHLLYRIEVLRYMSHHLPCSLYGRGRCIL